MTPLEFSPMFPFTNPFLIRCHYAKNPATTTLNGNKLNHNENVSSTKIKYTCLLTYLLTHSLHGAESFLRS